MILKSFWKLLLSINSLCLYQILWRIRRNPSISAYPCGWSVTKVIMAWLPHGSSLQAVDQHWPHPRIWKMHNWDPFQLIFSKSQSFIILLLNIWRELSKCISTNRKQWKHRENHQIFVVSWQTCCAKRWLVALIVSSGPHVAQIFQANPNHCKLILFHQL